MIKYYSELVLGIKKEGEVYVRYYYGGVNCVDICGIWGDLWYV